jgi:hypothetical protein
MGEKLIMGAPGPALGKLSVSIEPMIKMVFWDLPGDLSAKLKVRALVGIGTRKLLSKV